MPNLTPNAAPPGALADSRLGAETFARMRRASRIQVVSLSPEHHQALTTLAPDKARMFTGRIADLLHDDRLYTEEHPIPHYWGVVELRLLDPSPNARILLTPQRHELTINYRRGNVSSQTGARLEPIGVPLLELLRQIAPTDANLKRLAFLPKPVPNAPLPAMPENIRRDILSIQPGMRRADVRRILVEEGGISTRFDQRFVHPKSLGAVAPKGGVVAVSMKFVPASVPIRWLEGRGYGVKEISARDIAQDEMNDIVTYVSPPTVRSWIVD